MEFLNPLGLYAFSLLPVLLIPYLIWRRSRRIVFSSLLFIVRHYSSPGYLADDEKQLYGLRYFGLPEF